MAREPLLGLRTGMYHVADLHNLFGVIENPHFKGGS
jgi:hypothetical protein